MEREYEMMADKAIMNRIAINKTKGFKRSDLIKSKKRIPSIDSGGKKVDKSVWNGVNDLKFKEYKGI